MHWIDIVILISLVIAAISGFSKGFIVGLASLAGFVLGIYLSLRYAGIIEEILCNATGSQAPYMYVIAFFLCFTVVVIFVHFLGKSVEKIVEIAALGFMNRLAGAGFGVIKSLLVFAIIIHLLNVFDAGHSIIKPESKEKSIFYNPLSQVIPGVLPFLKNQIDRNSDENETPAIV
jgi:membrane protein required for colicin V production